MCYWVLLFPSSNMNAFQCKCISYPAVIALSLVPGFNGVLATYLAVLIPALFLSYFNIQRSF